MHTPLAPRVPKRGSKLINFKATRLGGFLTPKSNLRKGGNISTIDEFPWVFCSFPQQDLRLSKTPCFMLYFWVSEGSVPGGGWTRPLAYCQGGVILDCTWKLETNWLHSIEQSSWVISNENKYLSFLVLFCVTSFSETSNMFKLHQGHPSHKVTTPSILGFWEAKDRSSIFVYFFPSLEAWGQRRDGTVLLLLASQGHEARIVLHQRSNPQKDDDNVFPPASEKGCYLQDKWHILCFLEHMQYMFYHVLSIGFAREIPLFW